MFELIGTAGVLILCSSAIPQVVKTCRTKKCGDLSLSYLAALFTGLGLLQVYALHIRDAVFVFGNTLSLLTTGLLIVLWFVFRNRQKK